MSGSQLVLEEHPVGTLLSDCQVLAKKIELNQMNERLQERDHKFKLVYQTLTDIDQIKKQIAKSLVERKNSCRILKVGTCPCLNLEEIQIYAKALCPDLGPDFRLIIGEDRSGAYIEVRINW